VRRILAAAFLTLAVVVPVSAGAAGAKQAPTITFATPPDGATVAGPGVEIGVQVANFALVPAGSVNQSGKGHAHILIDETPPAPRAFLPTNDPSIVHMGSAPFDTRAIELTEGRHTLYAVLGDSEHLVVDQQPAKVTITVAPGLRAKGPLDQACAEFARGSGEVRMAFPIGGGAVQGTITATCAFATNSGQCTWTDASFRRVNGTFNPAQNAIVASAAGFTTRQLNSGGRKQCGQDRTTALSQQSFQAQIASGGIKGTLGRSTFALVADQSVRLAQPPTTVAASAGSGGGKKRSPYWPLPFVGAAALLIGAGMYAVRERQAVAPA
jgi:hypothetical protein